MRRGQAWSLDLVVAVIIFLLAVGIIYEFLLGRERGDLAQLRIESEVIATKLADDPLLQVAVNKQLDTTRMAGLATKSYDELKSDLGVKHEFCIFLQDENGNLIYIVDGLGNKYTGIGSGDGQLNLSGTPCGQVAP